MDAPSRLPRYDVRNDGIGPYAVFYCDKCEREFRSKPDVAATISKDIGREAVGGFLRKIPMVGGSVANSYLNDNPRYDYSLTPAQVEAAWSQVHGNFRECPTCLLVTCLSCFDVKSGYCRDDSPRAEEIAEAEASQAVGVMKGLAGAFGLGEVVRAAATAAKTASATSARCASDGTLAPAGTKFCPECGGPMIQPATSACPSCGADAKGAKFCPECGTKIAQAGPTHCPSCGVEAKGAKFCPECGTKIA
jgi:hypothetical protein